MPLFPFEALAVSVLLHFGHLINPRSGKFSAETILGLIVRFLPSITDQLVVGNETVN